MSEGQKSDHGFRQEIGLFSATMLVMGSMIGSGIFIVSKDIANDVQGAGWLLVVWAITGVMTVMGALCYAELAGMMPHAGGQYVYLKRAFSGVWGFLYGWTLFVVIQTGSIAAVAMAFMKFLGVFVPVLFPEIAVDPDTGNQVNSAMVVYRSPDTMNIKIELPLPWAEKPLTVFERNKFRPFAITVGQFLAAALLMALTLWNCLGVSKGTLLQNVFTVAKIGGLLMVIVVGFAFMNPEVVEFNKQHAWDGWQQTDRFKRTESAFPTIPAALIFAMVFGGAMVGSLFSADAWNNITFAGGEVKNPSRTLPLSLALGATGVIVLYLFVNLAYLAVLPVRPPAAEIKVPEGGTHPLTQTESLRNGISQAKDDRVAVAMVEQAMPRTQNSGSLGLTLVTILVLVSTFGCINGMILTGARLYYAMAKDRLFFRSVGTLNTRGVPAVALIMQGIWSAILVFSGSYNELLDFVMFAALLFYGLTIIGLIVLRSKEPNTHRPYRTLFYPILPIGYVLLCGLIMLDLLFVRPDATWPGLIIVLAGLPVYLFWRLFGGARSKA